MDNRLSEEYVGACMRAKQMTRFLPEPPAELQKRHIYILKTIYNLLEDLKVVRVSDIAESIDVTLPSITKNIAKLEELGYIKKEANADDRRVINIALTEKGLALYKEAVYDFHYENSQILKDVPEEDIHTTIKTIHRIYKLMEQHYLLD